MRVKVLAAVVLCVGLCLFSFLHLYHFYNPPLSGLTDAEATQYGFSDAQNMVDLSDQKAWNTNPRKKLALMKETYAHGNGKQKAVIFCSMTGIKDKETFRQAVELTKTQPQFWGDTPQHRATYVGLFFQFMEAGKDNKDVLEELTHDANLHVASIAADTLAYQKDLKEHDARLKSK